MIEIDGSFKEGGGQILRTSLGLSLLTKKSFKIKNIRAKRKKPGLMRQHLTALNAACEISNAEVSGNFIGSSEFEFKPQRVVTKDYAFAVGTAGSACLVLQTILPGFITGKTPLKIRLEGGTHNPFAPPYDFLKNSFFPVLKKMGVKIKSNIIRPGFYPAGGGIFEVEITPCAKLKPLDLTKKGELIEKRAFSLLSNLPEKIGERELKTVKKKLGIENLQVILHENSSGPGNVVFIETEYENITEVFTGFGEKGVSAERVANNACRLAKEYISSEACTGKYLADQILVPMAICGKGGFTTLKPSMHMLTNMEIIKQFLDIDIKLTGINENLYKVVLRR